MSRDLGVGHSIPMSGRPCPGIVCDGTPLIRIVRCYTVLYVDERVMVSLSFDGGPSEPLMAAGHQWMGARP